MGVAKAALEATTRRREAQLPFNRKHGVGPEGIRKEILPGIEEEIRAQKVVRGAVKGGEGSHDVRERIQDLEGRMLEAAQALDFELAAELRDRIKELTDPKTVPGTTRRAGSKR